MNYFYDNANRPSKATDAVNGLTYATGFQTPPTGTPCLATAVCYTPQGTPYATSIGQSSTFTGLNITETYNNRLQPSRLKATSTGGTAMDFNYSYTDPVTLANAGHVYGISNNIDSARSQNFAYDQLNRIISAQTTSTYATSPTKCWGETYSLDAWANLNSITPDPAFTGCSQEPGFSFTADGSNRLSAFLYDVAGNTTRDTVYTYNWNAESQLIYANAGANYAYDGDGRRVSKLNSSEPKLYWYGSGGEILTETSPTSLEITDYIYFGGKRVAQVANDFNLNGGFEAGLQGWSVSGSGTATAITNAANAHSGSQYADITSPANQTTTLTSTQPISAQRGETVSMTGWAYLESGTGGYVRWWVAVNGNSGQCVLSGSGSNATTLNTWVYQTGSVTIPAWCQGPYTVTVSAQIQSGSQAVSARFDDGTLNGNTLLFAEDSLGTTRVITDTSGVVCYDADFYPYGGERPYTNTCTTRYKFEGKERDAESGNDDFGARYYSNRFGRWLSSDWSAVPVAVPYANLTNPQTLNLYSMVGDDPESFADLDGHCGNQNEPDCKKMQNNPLANLSAAVKQAINDSVKASDKPTVDDKKGGSHEEGFVAYTKDGTQIVSPAQPGAYKDVMQPGAAEINPFKAADPSKAKPGDVQADIVEHVHPSAEVVKTSENNPSTGTVIGGSVTTQTYNFNQGPSKRDVATVTDVEHRCRRTEQNGLCL